MKAVSDTSPLSYLVLIGRTDLLPKLFTAVSIPEAVRAELASGRAPSAIQKWISQPPPWLVIDPRTLPADARWIDCTPASVRPSCWPSGRPPTSCCSTRGPPERSLSAVVFA